jgi:hypothetical protein
LEFQEREASALGNLVNRVRREPETAAVTAREASDLLGELCSATGLDPSADEGRFPGEPDVYWNEWDGWTTGHLRAAAATYASRRKTKGSKDGPGLLDTLAFNLAIDSGSAAGARDIALRNLHRRREATVLLRADEADRVQRYEAHLQR